MNKLIIAGIALALTSTAAIATSDWAYGKSEALACAKAWKDWNSQVDYLCDRKGYVATGQSTEIMKMADKKYRCTVEAAYQCN